MRLSTFFPPRRLAAGTCAITVAATLALSGGMNPAAGAPTPPIDPVLQAQIDSLIDPSDDLIAAVAKVNELAKTATDAQERSANAREDAADAQRRADAAQDRAEKATAEARAAQAEADAARAKLGQYAASAYINGGSAAGMAATLESESPTQMVSRQNTLDAVAGTSTDLLRVLKASQAKADQQRAVAASAARTARAASETASIAATTARDAAQAAMTAAEDADRALADIVGRETEAQAQRVADALARVQADARAAAYAAAVGGKITDVPAEYLVFGNGRVPREALSPVATAPGHWMWPPAARALEALMNAAAQAGVPFTVTDSYRPFEVQVRLAEQKGLYSQGGLAARPGYSNHGWGTAADLNLSGSALSWLRANAVKYGFVEDVPRESWHWHFIGTAESGGTAVDLADSVAAQLSGSQDADVRMQ